MAKTFARTKRGTLGIHFTVQVWKENDAYVAYAPELDVSSCGESLAQAKKRLHEAVSLFLEEASRMETLEDILAEAGFEKHGNNYRTRRVLAREKVRLAVPILS
jgi:predicted RNase H-like HicB family nuclease